MKKEDHLGWRGELWRRPWGQKEVGDLTNCRGALPRRMDREWYQPSKGQVTCGLVGDTGTRLVLRAMGSAMIPIVKCWDLICNLTLFFFKILFIFRERGRERKREGEKHQCVVACRVSLTGEPGPQPRHGPGLGIEPVTLSFTVLCSIQPGYNLNFKRMLWLLVWSRNHRGKEQRQDGGVRQQCHFFLKP